MPGAADRRRMAYTLATMSRIWTKKISNRISATVCASMPENGNKFNIEKITIMSESDSVRVELLLDKKDIKGLLLLIEEGEKGIVKHF